MDTTYLPQTGDSVAYEANGRPDLYEGTVTSVGPNSMTVLLDNGRYMGIRYASIDALTITHCA